MIRLLTSEDHGVWKELRLESLQAHPDAYLITYEEEKAYGEERWADMLKTSRIFVNFADGLPVALAGYTRPDRTLSKHRATLFAVYTRPTHRGQGITDTLVRAVEQDAAELGVEQMHLGVGIDNRPALGCYKRAGYAIYGTDPRRLKLGERYIDEHLMVKML